MFILSEAPAGFGCRSESILVGAYGIPLEGRISESAVCFILKKLFMTGLLSLRTGDSWCFILAPLFSV